VSCYAFFKGLLPLSQPPNRLFKNQSCTLDYNFKILTNNLGYFPFDYEAYPPQSDSRGTPTRYSEFGWEG